MSRGQLFQSDNDLFLDIGGCGVAGLRGGTPGLQGINIKACSSGLFGRRVQSSSLELIGCLELIAFLEPIIFKGHALCSDH